MLKSGMSVGHPHFWFGPWEFVECAYVLLARLLRIIRIEKLLWWYKNIKAQKKRSR